jgi:hypothetical protein
LHPTGQSAHSDSSSHPGKQPVLPGYVYGTWWNARMVASWVYFCRLKQDGRVVARLMVVIRQHFLPV